MWRQMQVTGALARHWNAVDVQGANDAPFPAGGKLAGVRGPGGAPLQPMPRVSFAARATGAALLGTARLWRGIVPFTHLAREGRMTVTIGRRELLAALGGAVAAWPLAARGQQRERMRRIGVLHILAEDDPESRLRIAAFKQSLQEFGWTDGSNVQIEARWAAGNADNARKYAAELTALAPDVILAEGSPSVAALRSATRTVPIVFVSVIDPVGAGFVESLARPGGNATGFLLFEYSLGGKWLELLKEIAPRVTRVAVLRDTGIAAGSGQLGAIQSVAPSFGVELRPVDVRDATEIERAVAAFARSANGGLIVTASALSGIHRALIVALAARHKLPAVYYRRDFVTGGGLVAYGPDFIDPFRRAAAYVDRILKGEKLADLPVQAPTKYGLVINLKTAKALGIEVPPTLIARADEVIE
jgi:putative ABC transport system substrate-binding protein